MSRIGVFICHCGENISRTVDVERVAREVGQLPGVAFSTDYNMPVFYLTQLVGLAVGLGPDKLGLDAMIVNPMPLLKEKGLL